MRHGSLALISALAVVGAFGASVAIGASNTSVTIKSHDEEGVLDGKVKSDKPSCKPGRSVTLWWDEPGPDEFDEVADAETNANGKWSIESPTPPTPPGKYYAKVAKDGNCDKAKSETIRVRD